MLKFTRSFNEVAIRMARNGHNVFYSAYDVTKALKIETARRAVNEAIITESGSFMELVFDGNEKALFISSEYVIALAWKADWTIGKRFVKWMIETIDVAKRMQDEGYSRAAANETYFAVTQIAKKYGLTAMKLNDILYGNCIQYKVNDQWVLYAEHAEQGYTKTVKVKKAGKDDEFVYHTYWTEKGANFIESLLDRLGYKQQGKQLDLF